MDDIIKPEIQEVNITSLWYKDIYESLSKIADFERICRDGAVSILEWVQLPRERLAEIQFQYLRMMITEMNLLLGNVQVLIDSYFLITSISKIRTILYDVDNRNYMFLFASANQQNHTTTYFVTEHYWKVLQMISQIREELVVKLTPILFGTATEKASGMDKTLATVKKVLLR